MDTLGITVFVCVLVGFGLLTGYEALAGPPTVQKLSGVPPDGLNVAVYKDDELESDLSIQVNYPCNFKEILTRSKHTVTFLDSRQIGDARELSANEYSLLMLSYGGCIPMDSAYNVSQFLADGGNIICNGAPFTRPIENIDGVWTINKGLENSSLLHSEFQYSLSSSTILPPPRVFREPEFGDDVSQDIDGGYMIRYHNPRFNNVTMVLVPQAEPSNMDASMLGTFVEHCYKRLSGEKDQAYYESSALGFSWTLR